jgi:hypothetical protein
MERAVSSAGRAAGGGQEEWRGGVLDEAARGLVRTRVRKGSKEDCLGAPTCIGLSNVFVKRPNPPLLLVLSPSAAYFLSASPTTSRPWTSPTSPARAPGALIPAVDVHGVSIPLNLDKNNARRTMKTRRKAGGRGRGRGGGGNLSFAMGVQ